MDLNILGVSKGRNVIIVQKIEVDFLCEMRLSKKHFRDYKKKNTDSG